MKANTRQLHEGPAGTSGGSSSVDLEASLKNESSKKSGSSWKSAAHPRNAPDLSDY